MDDDVGGAPQFAVGLVQSEPVAGDVAGDGPDAARDGVVEVVAVCLAEPVEGVVLQDLALGAACGGRAATVADEQDEFAVRHAAQQPFDERGADEPGRPGDRNALARQRGGDRVGHHG